MNAIVRNIPNSVTCMNLIAGCLAIYCATKGADALWGLKGWEWAAIFIGIGAVADFLDGFCARLLKAYSDLGKELDSLCDLVSFGVAPALMLIYLLPSCGMPQLMAMFTILIPVAAAVRLARFNIDTRQASCFIGLPVPANAIFWIGFCGLANQGAAFLLIPVIFFIILLFECWLMLSPLKLFSLKFRNYRLKENLSRYILIAGTVVLVFCMGVGGLLWLIVFYLLLSLTFKTDV